MTPWLIALKTAIEQGEAATLVTIADTRGSAPREAGVKMLVTARASIGTVGGGNLEHEAIRIARAMIEEGREQNLLRPFALGPALGQCCGGSTQLLFDPLPQGTAMPAWIEALTEPLASSLLVSKIEGRGTEKLVIGPDGPIHGENGAAALATDPALLDQAWLFFEQPKQVSTMLWRRPDGQRYFLERNPESLGSVLLMGAGHVGKALAKVLAPLPFALTWADNRPEQYPAEIDPSIRVRCTPHLETVVDEAPSGAIYLVMTYSHDLDYALCARALRRGDFRFLGLIGSDTKRAKFEKTMTDLGIDRALIDRVVCPIGLPGIDSKQPSVIAIATAAQLLALSPR